MSAGPQTVRPDAARAEGARSGSFGQQGGGSPIDRFGVWLSHRSLRRHCGDLRGARVADIGCGFAATFASTLVGEADTILLADLAVDPALAAAPGVRVIEGVLPASLAAVDDASQDLVMCMSVVEHVWDDAMLLSELHRIAAPGATVVVNVPSWLGKTALEFSAFRLGLSPREEMNDHKRYYDPRDLWPMLVAAGFVPEHIRCRRHKFGLNTLAVCRKLPPTPDS